MFKRLLTYTCLLTLTLPHLSYSQTWSPKNTVPEGLGQRYITPEKGLIYATDFEALKELLKTAPPENSGAGLKVFIPSPEGFFEEFEIWSYPLISGALAEQLPEIGTYLGRSTQNPANIIRLDHTYQGFHAMVLALGGSWYIDPVIHLETTYYQTYYKKDLLPSKDFSCSLKEDVPVSFDQSDKNINPNGAALRTYRIAISATGEYTSFHGGTVALAQSAQVTTMNRVNGIYERDLAIRMTIIPNNHLIIYTNANTDPFTNGTPSSMINQNQTNTNSVIGSANYDIGHIFGTNSGGLASLGSVCGSSKARGVTGSGAPVGDPFDIDYVAHEIGHQFGAPHTFNSSTSGCSGNRSGTYAYEPGSGVTILGYAGLCGSDNLAQRSIDQFHAGSYAAIYNFINGSGGSCAVETPTENILPVVDAGPSTYHIPLSTPFRLTAKGSQIDSGEQVTYCWEQYDLGSSTSLAQNPTSGTHPLFRTYLVDTSATRVFPRMQTLINNQTDNAEKLPYYGRRLRFRVTMRDNHPNGGGVSQDSMSIWAVANSTPFSVSYPSNFTVWQIGTQQTITWVVGQTTSTPINSQNVNIKISIDGGYTYPYTLASGIANNGSYTITVPDLGGLQNRCRIMVEAADNIFFDISNANFTIQPDPVEIPEAEFTVSSNARICEGGRLNFADQSTNQATDWIWTFEGGSPSGSSVKNPTNISFPSAGNYTVTLTVSNSAGNSTLSKTVTVNPKPQADFTITYPTAPGQNNGSILASPYGGTEPYTVQWAISPPKTDTLLDNIGTGYYIANVFDSNGCSTVFNLSVQGFLDVSEHFQDEFNIFPNPASSFLTIQSSTPYVNYTISDISGKILLNGRTQSHSETIDINILPSGVYAMRVWYGNIERVHKVIKK